MKIALIKEGGVQLHEQYLEYEELLSGKEYIHFRLRNQQALDTRSHIPYPVFRHTGYYLFARSEQARSAVEQHLHDSDLDIIPQDVIYNRGLIGDDLRRRIKCRAALSMGMPEYGNTEFKEIIKAMETYSDYHASSHHSEVDTFSDDLIEFVLGDDNQKIFMGGSGHSRLMLDWIMPHSDDFVLLLSPSDFANMNMETSLGDNVVELGRSIPKSSELAKAITDLADLCAIYVDEISNVESRLSKNGDVSKGKNVILRNLISVIAHEHLQVRGGDWCFLTGIRMMEQIARKDNDLGQRIDWRRLPRTENIGNTEEAWYN